jgi:hypothetical protein
MLSSQFSPESTCCPSGRFESVACNAAEEMAGADNDMQKNENARAAVNPISGRAVGSGMHGLPSLPAMMHAYIGQTRAVCRERDMKLRQLRNFKGLGFCPMRFFITSQMLLESNEPADNFRLCQAGFSWSLKILPSLI